MDYTEEIKNAVAEAHGADYHDENDLKRAW